MFLFVFVGSQNYSNTPKKKKNCGLLSTAADRSNKYGTEANSLGDTKNMVTAELASLYIQSGPFLNPQPS